MDLGLAHRPLYGELGVPLGALVRTETRYTSTGLDFSMALKGPVCFPPDVEATILKGNGIVAAWSTYVGVNLAPTPLPLVTNRSQGMIF